jgi:hypothetical protein
MVVVVHRLNREAAPRVAEELDQGGDRAAAYGVPAGAPAAGAAPRMPGPRAPLRDGSE